MPVWRLRTRLCCSRCDVTMLSHLIVVMFGLAIVQLQTTEAFCGQSPIVWRNNNLTCPRNAICGDVFDQMRDWQNGTTCQETRILSNCLCPNGHVCPFNDPDYQIYSSQTHKHVMCRPACNFSRCPPGPGLTRRRGNVAITSVHGARDFNGAPYNQVNCICPRHMRPANSGGRSWAVEWYRSLHLGNRWTTEYVCDAEHHEYELPNPCLRN